MYEYIRKIPKRQEEWKNLFTTLLVFAFVGPGYPLRFLLGAMMAENFRWEGMLTAMLITLYFYGLVMVIILWNIEIKKISRDSGEATVWTKLHYEVMYKNHKWIRVWMIVFGLGSGIGLVYPLFKGIKLSMSQIFCLRASGIIILGSYATFWMMSWPKTDVVQRCCKKVLNTVLKVLLPRAAIEKYLPSAITRKDKK